MNPTPRSFRARSFTSLVIATGFVMLAVSGGILLISPPGRIANWTRWELLGLTKRGWSDLHVTFAILFLLAALAHVAFNVRPLLQHLGIHALRPRTLRREVIVALLLGLAVFTGTLTRTPPFSTLLAWSEGVRESWDDQRDRAPIPHAELLTLRELAKEAGVELDEATRRLSAAGIRNPSADERVGTLAESANLPPARLYEMLQRAGSTTTTVPRPGAERGLGSGSGSGGGPGRKTLKQFCADEGIDIQIAQDRLARRGIRGDPNQTLRELATQHGYDRPYVLLEILRGN